MPRIVALMLGLVLTLVACSTAPSTAEKRADLEVNANRAIDRAKASDPGLATILDNAAGYAVFPTVGKGGAGIGGAYGRGILYENHVPVGYCDLSQASIGFQLGGQAYTEIICFENEDALSHFKSGNLAFDARASAVALKSGASAEAQYADGVMVFTLGETGLMYQASIGGQRFTYQPK